MAFPEGFELTDALQMNGLHVRLKLPLLGQAEPCSVSAIDLLRVRIFVGTPSCCIECMRFICPGLFKCRCVLRRAMLGEGSKCRSGDTLWICRIVIVMGAFAELAQTPLTQKEQDRG